MTIPSFKSNDPLYIVIVRQDDAHQLLQQWVKNNRVQALVEKNRMSIFDHNALSMFQLHWPHDWDNVTIWDAWNRRHINSF